MLLFDPSSHSRPLYSCSLSSPHMTCLLLTHSVHEQLCDLSLQFVLLAKNSFPSSVTDIQHFLQCFSRPFPSLPYWEPATACLYPTRAVFPFILDFSCTYFPLSHQKLAVNLTTNCKLLLCRFLSKSVFSLDSGGSCL